MRLGAKALRVPAVNVGQQSGHGTQTVQSVQVAPSGQPLRAALASQRSPESTRLLPQRGRVVVELVVVVLVVVEVLVVGIVEVEEDVVVLEASSAQKTSQPSSGRRFPSSHSSPSSV
jgi:hypothetical protein